MPLSRHMEYVQEISSDLSFIAHDFAKRFNKAEYVGLQTVEADSFDFMGEKWSGIKITAIFRHPKMYDGEPMQIYMIAQRELLDRNKDVIIEWQTMFDALLQNDMTLRTFGGLVN